MGTFVLLGALGLLTVSCLSVSPGTGLRVGVSGFPVPLGSLAPLVGTGAMVPGPSGSTATFPYGNVSIVDRLPNATLPGQSVLEVTYAFHILSFPKGHTGIQFDVPQLQTTFPTVGGGQIVLYTKGQTYNVTGTGTVGGAGTLTKATIASGGTGFTYNAKAVMSSQLLAIMDSVPWGTAQISFSWSWSAVPSGGGPAIASGTSPTPSIQPQEYVAVVSDGPSTVAPGQNFTVCVGGTTIQGRVLSLHMEVPDPYYAFAWNTTHIPKNATSPYCWSVMMPVWFNHLPTPLLVHIWSYANQPGILYVLHTNGVPRVSGTLRGEVVPANATVNFRGSPIAVGAGGAYRALLNVGSGYLNASAPGYHPGSRWVTISKDSVTWANLTLALIDGELQGTVRPGSAVIDVGRTEVNASAGQYHLALVPGSYTVNATATGFFPDAAEVTVRAGLTSWANFTLLARPPPGPPTYPVTFTAVGIRAGTPWSVLVNGTVHSSFETAPISFRLPNGTYPVTVPSVGDLEANGTPSLLVLDGRPVQWAITFVPRPPVGLPRIPIDFEESGLATGAVWSVVVNATTYRGVANAAIRVPLTAGSYAYTIPAILGYTANTTGGTVHVLSSPEVVEILFSPAVPPGARGVQPPNLFTTENLVGGFVIAVAIGGIAVVGIRAVRRSRPPSR